MISEVPLPVLLVLLTGVIFLVVLGRHAWPAVMKSSKVLLVVVGLPLALMIAYWSAGHRHPPGLEAPSAFVMDPVDQGGTITVGPTVEVELLAPDGRVIRQPLHHQLMVPDRPRGAFDIQAQVRTPAVRGRWSVLFLFLVAGAVAFAVVHQVRRGEWSWPGVLKFGALAAGACFLIVMVTHRVRWEEARRNEARMAAEQAQVAAELFATSRARAVGAPAIDVPAVDVPAVDVSAVPEWLKQFRDADVWRRESVLGFVPSSHKEMPDWCREGLETKPVAVRLQNAAFLTPLPEGREWIAGYSSQNPQMAVAQAEAIAAARGKLALAALLEVKDAVPELDIRPLEEIGASIAQREELGSVESQYVEKATLVRDQRPYGSVYRVAVRIAADPATVDSLARRICLHIDRFGSGQPDLGIAFFSGVILVVLAFSAFLVYVFIRAGATGNWALPLRLVSGGMLAAIAAAVVYVTTNLRAS